MSAKKGFRTPPRWRGKAIETLADVPPKPGGVLIVGINPSPVSVAAGHCYQGTLGRRLWARLRQLRVLRETDLGREDEALAEEGHGLTDIVKRSTRSAAEVTHEELTAGAKEVLKKIRRWQPGLILFPFGLLRRGAPRSLSPSRTRT
jgi:TDG/mug DNA glycosylase family protein